MNNISPERIEKAVSCIAAEIGHDFLEAPKRRVDERDLWTEMTCCVLSSQVPYDLSRAAAQRINDSGVLCLDGPRRPGVLRAKLAELLSTPLHVNGAYRRYRFPNSRADQIASGFCTVYEEFGSLGELLRCHSDARCARVWMVVHMPGVGPKQASMFLRNTAASYDLAVIDRHVLRYMYMVDLCTSPESDVTTIDKYERCEIQLQRYASSMGYPVGLLDWAIWIVMRAASRINKA
jgi:N-glycosylase/DNA lyase